ncbi:class F sortase [Candidatus Kaiserbacteria bacterium]|nr:class F sortase [Candidatus Kaiserbacteria bacterium]MCB9812102.1 class F sortase [Candidatus Nomurabacteria bacterium]
MSQGNKITNFWTKSHHLKVVAFAILGAVVGAAITHLAIVSFDRPLATESTFEPPAIDTVSEVKEVADPVWLRVPSVGIDTAFAGPLGLNEDQTVEVPDGYEEVGWYRYGPKPGELGPAVVLGHVDSYQGPAVFWPLQKVRAGDTIEIERADGTVGVFVVTRLEQHSRSGFPTAEVYGDIDHAGLRLITCSGTFNHGRQEYSHNLIVYAELVEDIPALSATGTPVLID